MLWVVVQPSGMQGNRHNYSEHPGQVATRWNAKLRLKWKPHFCNIGFSNSGCEFANRFIKARQNSDM